jgi:hypothetical protein
MELAAEFLSVHVYELPTTAGEDDPPETSNDERAKRRLLVLSSHHDASTGTTTWLRGSFLSGLKDIGRAVNAAVYRLYS